MKVYKPKTFNLSGLNGISDKTLEMHFKLYEGYVTNTNTLTAKIAAILADGTVDKELKDKLQQHVSQCPNCWVVLDTTQRTIKVYKGLEPQTIPPDIHSRLMTALNKKMAATQKPT